MVSIVSIDKASSWNTTRKKRKQKTCLQEGEGSRKKLERGRLVPCASTEGAKRFESGPSTRACARAVRGEHFAFGTVRGCAVPSHRIGASQAADGWASVQHPVVKLSAEGVTQAARARLASRRSTIKVRNLQLPSFARSCLHLPNHNNGYDINATDFGGSV